MKSVWKCLPKQDEKVQKFVILGTEEEGRRTDFRPFRKYGGGFWSAHAIQALLKGLPSKIFDSIVGYLSRKFKDILGSIVFCLAAVRRWLEARTCTQTL